MLLYVSQVFYPVIFNYYFVYENWEDISPIIAVLFTLFLIVNNSVFVISVVGVISFCAYGLTFLILKKYDTVYIANFILIIITTFIFQHVVDNAEISKRTEFYIQTNLANEYEQLFMIVKGTKYITYI